MNKNETERFEKHILKIKYFFSLQPNELYIYIDEVSKANRIPADEKVKNDLIF